MQNFKYSIKAENKIITSVPAVVLIKMIKRIIFQEKKIFQEPKIMICI